VQCRRPVHRECGALFWKNREMYFSPAREEQIILATASSRCSGHLGSSRSAR